MSLNVVSESLLHDLLRRSRRQPDDRGAGLHGRRPGQHRGAAARCTRNGNTLLIKGRPLRELPREVLPCFKHSIIDLADERRDRRAARRRPASTRTIPHVQSGVRTIAEMEASFERGAHAVLGWPIDDAIDTTAARSGKAAAQPDLQVIVELIHRVDSEEPIDKLESTLKRDPTLAFKLMRYINSPAFGLRVEISSFRHAIMMLGYQRLKRWLALLLATASKDVNLKPVMFAAVRRGLLMEELVARQRRRGDAQRDVHLRRVLAARPDVPPALRRAARLDPGARAGATRRWSTAPGRTSRTWRWCGRSSTSRCSTSATPPRS